MAPVALVAARAQPAAPPARLHRVVHGPVGGGQVDHCDGARAAPAAPGARRVPARRRQCALRPVPRPGLLGARPAREHSARCRGACVCVWEHVFFFLLWSPSVFHSEPNETALPFIYFLVFSLIKKFYHTFPSLPREKEEKGFFAPRVVLTESLHV